jgi:hypothetical protein
MSSGRSEYRFRAIRRVKSGALSLILIGALLLPVSALGASPKKSASISLGARNLLSGSETAKMQVRVPRSATIEKPLAGGSGVSVKGGDNGFVGFALVERTSDDDRIAFVGGRLEERTGLPPVVMGLGGPDNTRSDLKVPAGEYDLYLITESPGVEVILRLKGLAGRKSLRPQGRVTAKMVTPEPDYSSGGVDGAPKNLYSAGAGGRTRGSGLLFDVLWQKRQVHVDTLNTFCYYLEKPDPQHPAPYAPGCPASSARLFSVINDGLVNGQPSQAVHYGGAMTVGTTYVGQGFSVTSAGLIDDLDYTALWLSF